jgi:hypothetical protein
MTSTFAVTWDYRCPFARNAHEHLLTGLAAGADWEVTFLPFSLGQAHVEEGQPSVWEDPGQDTGIVALQAGVVVRNEHPDRFPAVHRALFAARHDHGEKLDDPQVVRKVLRAHEIDDHAVFALIDAGDALELVKAEHEKYAESHTVWGVPTFLVGDQASFVRLMHRAPDGADPAESIRTIDRVVELLAWPDLNEFKHTSIPR